MKQCILLVSALSLPKPLASAECQVITFGRRSQSDILAHL